MGDRLWSGESHLWLWLIAAAAVGWLAWWALVVRRRDGAESRIASTARAPGHSPRRPALTRLWAGALDRASGSLAPVARPPCPAISARAPSKAPSGRWRRRLTVLAGGTDIYPARVGRSFDEDVLDISRLAALRHRRAGRPLVDRGARHLDEPAGRPAAAVRRPETCRARGRRRADPECRHGGGNLCNASPAADGVPALLAWTPGWCCTAVTANRCSRCRTSFWATAGRYGAPIS